MKNEGTLIIKEIRPYDSADTYPSAYANELKGGHYQVALLTDRNVIPALRRLEGMFCYVAEDGKYYKLKSDLTTWEEFSAVETFIFPTFLLALGVNCTVGVNKTNELIFPTISGTLIEILARAKTGPTGTDLIFDLNINGVSIWNITPANRLKILSGQVDGNQTIFDVTTLIEGDILTIDVDQIGSIVAGKNITVELKIRLN